MDLEQRLREGLAAPDPGAEFTDCVMARVANRAKGQRRRVIAFGGMQGRNRWLTRFIFVGIVTAAGIAAAMLAERLARVPAHSAEKALVATPTIAVPHTTTAPKVSANSKSAELRIDQGQAASAPSPMPQQVNTAPRYTVLVAPVLDEVQDPVARRQVEIFYAAVLQGLRNIPGLTLLTQDDAAKPSEQQSIYVLVLIGLEVEGRPDVVRVEYEIKPPQWMHMAEKGSTAFSADGTRGATVAERAEHFVGSLRARYFPGDQAQSSQ